MWWWVVQLQNRITPSPLDLDLDCDKNIKTSSENSGLREEFVFRFILKWKILTIKQFNATIYLLVETELLNMLQSFDLKYSAWAGGSHPVNYEILGSPF